VPRRIIDGIAGAGGQPHGIVFGPPLVHVMPVGQVVVAVTLMQLPTPSVQVL
jgi:hypothetical protein